MHSSTILIADGDHLQRQRLEIQLMSRNYKVVSFAKGQEVLEYFQNNTPALAVLAANLPDINGTDVCGKIKGIKRLRHVPVIITVAQQRYNTVKSLARAVRADLVLPQPSPGRDIFDYIQELLGAEERPPEPEDNVVERALKRLETKSPRQLEEEDDVRGLIQANQSLHHQLEALRKSNEHLEAAVSEGGSEEIDRLKEENASLKERLANTTELDTLRRNFEALKLRYAKLEASIHGRDESESSDDSSAEALRQELEESRETNRHLEARLAESETNLEGFRVELDRLLEQKQGLEQRLEAATQNPEHTIYQGEVETLETLEELQAQQQIQLKQIETLRKHNKRLLESISTFQVTQPNRKNLWDRFKL